MERIKYGLSKCSYFTLFIVIEAFLLLCFAVYNLMRHGAPLNSVMLSAQSQFADYFMHIGYASAPFGTNIYNISTKVCFPPLAYLLYGILARWGGGTV